MCHGTFSALRRVRENICSIVFKRTLGMLAQMFNRCRCSTVYTGYRRIWVWQYLWLFFVLWGFSRQKGGYWVLIGFFETFYISSDLLSFNKSLQISLYSIRFFLLNHFIKYKFLQQKIYEVDLQVALIHVRNRLNQMSHSWFYYNKL